jgi:hypothetical protein
MSVELTGKGKAPWGNHGASQDGRGVVGARGDSRPLAGATPQCLVSSRRLGQQPVRAELAKNAPPIDYAATYDSLDVMEKVMRRFYLRGLVEESMGTETDWKMADSAFVQAAAIAEKVARYRHAALSAVRLAGDINATVTDGLSLDELLVKIKEELRNLGPLSTLKRFASRKV